MIAYFIIGVGVLLTFFGIIGTWILPDLLLRLHASTKCGVTGAVTMIFGLTLMSAGPAMAIKLCLIMGFIFATAPLVAHIVAMGHYAEQEDR